VHNGIGRVQVEDGTYSLPLLVGEGMPVAAALLACLVAHEFGDDSLIDSASGEVLVITLFQRPLHHAMTVHWIS
jgi:hydroxymethylglutaryl-CoA reductase